MFYSVAVHFWLTYENCDKGTKSLSEELPSTEKDCKVCLVTLIKKALSYQNIGLDNNNFSPNIDIQILQTDLYTFP